MRVTKEIVHWIGLFLEEEEQIECCSCCQEWYQELLKVYFRRIRIHMRKWIANSEKMVKLLQMLPLLLNNPSQQVEIILDNVDTLPDQNVPLIIRLLEVLNYSVKLLKFEERHLDLLTSLLQYLSCRTVELHIVTSMPLLDTFNAFSTSHDNLRALEYLSINMHDHNQQLPHIPSIKRLSIQNCDVHNPIPLTYLNQLQCLNLFKCSLSDVSMFGSISELSLRHCHNIHDISLLNDNQKITIESCFAITDYTHCCMNSQEIDIQLANFHLIQIDISRWRRVKKLTLFAGSGELVHIASNSILSNTVRTLILQGIDLRQQLPTELKELSLYQNRLISLKELGISLSNLVVIQLSLLTQLTSIEGLGEGKNQKVTIYNCPLITDYSPLRYVHEVEIITNSIVHLAELDNVHTLTITAKELQIDIDYCYDHIRYLRISIQKPPPSLKGLERIHHLCIDDNCSGAFMTLLESGERLLNGRIDLSWMSRSFKRLSDPLLNFLEKDYMKMKRPTILTFIRKNY